MLRPKKKISKKEMKVDPLISTYSKVTNFYYENKKYISYALTGVVVIILAIIIYRNNQIANEERAAVELGKIFPVFDQGNYLSAIDGQPDKGINGLKYIVEEFGSTPSGNFARFYLANAYYELGETDKALEEFGDVSVSDNIVQASVYAGIAACYERKEDNINAAKYYDKAGSKATNPTISVDYQNLAARNYGLGGKKEKAIDILNRIKKEHPTHQAARDADRYIAQFSN